VERADGLKVGEDAGVGPGGEDGLQGPQDALARAVQVERVVRLRREELVENFVELTHRLRRAARRVAL